MTESFDIAQAKSRLSELMNRVAYGKERFLICKRGRPVAAIVSTEDLAQLECAPQIRRGLLGAVGALSDIDDWDELIDDVVRSRSRDRDVRLE